MNAKKSILVYFDSYPMLVSLPLAQRGLLFTILLIYGERLSRENTDLEEIMEQFPKLTPEARLVCGFMGASILRDTQRWLSRRQRQAASRTEKRGTGEPTPDAKMQADMERVRRLLELSKAEDP